MHPLLSLPVLFLDCQTTGTQAASCHIVEVAWSVASAEVIARLGPDKIDLASSLVRLPPDVSFPRIAQQVTGLRPEDLLDAPEPIEVWARIVGATDDEPAVAHYARFEEAFLRPWSGEAPFPFRILCTHRFAKRLFPTLPSASIRAVSGFLGRDTADLRRAAGNVRTTAWIWEQLVYRFCDDHPDEAGDFEALIAWIDNKPKSKGSKTRVYQTARSRRLSLPRQPGVYRFLSKENRVLYVGKATNLHDRVNSYYRARRIGRKRISELMAQVHDIDATETATPVEAALLETDEIKRLRPPYNSALRELQYPLVYCPRDFSGAYHHPDKSHPAGPFVSFQRFDILHALARAIEGESPPPELFFGLEDEETLRAGLQLFCDRHAGEHFDVPGLLRLGEHLSRRSVQDTERTEEENEESEEEPEWTAEDVADSAERKAMGAVREARRARWICRMTDAAISWTPCPGSRRLLRIEESRLVEATWIPDDAPLPVPSGWRRSLLERQKSIDAKDFDRLRVLLSEVQRLSRDGTPLAMRFGPGAKYLGRM